jgi:hypothetical protein
MTMERRNSILGPMHFNYFPSSILLALHSCVMLTKHAGATASAGGGTSSATTAAVTTATSVTSIGRLNSLFSGLPLFSLYPFAPRDAPSNVYNWCAAELAVLLKFGPAPFNERLSARAFASPGVFDLPALQGAVRNLLSFLTGYLGVDYTDPLQTLWCGRLEDHTGLLRLLPVEYLLYEVDSILLDWSHALETMRSDAIAAETSSKCTASFLIPTGPHDYLCYLVRENFACSYEREQRCRHFYATTPPQPLAPVALFSPTPAVTGPSSAPPRLHDEPSFHVTLDNSLRTPKPAAVTFAPLPPGPLRAPPGGATVAASAKTDPAATTCWNHVAAHLRVVNPKTKQPYACPDGPNCVRQHPAAGWLARLDKETFTRYITHEWKFPQPMRSLCAEAISNRKRN